MKYKPSFEQTVDEENQTPDPAPPGINHIHPQQVTSLHRKLHLVTRQSPPNMAPGTGGLSVPQQEPSPPDLSSPPENLCLGI